MGREWTFVLLLCVTAWCIVESQNCWDPYPPDTGVCCDGTWNIAPPGFRACCETKAFNRTSHKCCNGVIAPRDFPEGMYNDSCCHYQTMYVDIQICCDNTLQPRHAGPNTACCQHVAYDNTVYQCCVGPVLVPIGTPCPNVDTAEQQVRPKFFAAMKKDSDQ